MLVVRIAALAAICALLPALTATGDERLAIRVTPAIAPAPAFYTSSQVPLNGDRSPRTSEVRLAGLPSGVYRVSATLLGSQGPRAEASSSIMVATTPGQR